MLKQKKTNKYTHPNNKYICPNRKNEYTDIPKQKKKKQPETAKQKKINKQKHPNRRKSINKNTQTEEKQ
jgi:hypothetical protein